MPVVTQNYIKQTQIGFIDSTEDVGDNQQFQCILDANSHCKCGHTMVIHPGTYNLGNKSIELKTDIHWKFYPGVIITSSNNEGTFINNQESRIFWEGEPTIINTNGLGKRISLHKKSILTGFVWELNSIISQSGEDIEFEKICKNTLGGTVQLMRDSEGIYRIRLAGAFKGTTVTVNNICPLMDTVCSCSLILFDSVRKKLYGYAIFEKINDNRIMLYVYNDNKQFQDINGIINLNIKVYP